MKEHVTVIPSDGIIIVDKIVLPCEFESHISGLHAIQWHNGKGELEIVNDGNIRNVAVRSYADEVQPYVDIWQSKYDEINTADTPTFEELKARQLAELNAAFAAASETAHCLSSFGFEINADGTAARNISNLIVVLEETDRNTAQFCAFDNTFHEVTLTQLKVMRLEIIDNAEAIYQRKWVLRKAINAAATLEELDAIRITFGEENEQTA